MNYKLFNTGNTDQQIPLRHGSPRKGVMGAAGGLPSILSIPGKARAEEGKNFAIIDEAKLRGIFGFYKFTKPGVVDPTKPCDISPKHVKFNAKLLDSGRIIVVDNSGKHVLGIGGAEYQKATLDNTQAQNAMLIEQQERFVKMLINDLGMSEEDATAVVKNKQAGAQGILKKYKGVIGVGADVVDTDTGGSEDTVDEVFSIYVGDEPVPVKEYKTLDGAIKKIKKMAEDADSPVDIVDDLPQYTDADGNLVKIQ